MGLFVAIALATAASSYVILKPASYVQTMPADASPLSANLYLSPQPPKPLSATQLSLTITDANGAPATLLSHHGRLAHMMIVANDFSSFGHLHPEDFGELCVVGEQSVALRHSLQYRFPEPGRYLAAVNVATADQTLNQGFQLRIPGAKLDAAAAGNTQTTACFRGYPQTAEDQYSSPVISTEAQVSCNVENAYEVKLITPPALRANEKLRLGYRIQQNGQPLTDLQPYLAAGLHLAVASEPIEKHPLQHLHGMPVDEAGEPLVAAAISTNTSQHHASADHHLPPPAAFGPKILTEPLQFPDRGRYRLFGQFKHDNDIVFTQFTVDVEAGFSNADATFVELALTNRSLRPNNVQVFQGDNVVLNISSAGNSALNSASNNDELHITGYEIEKSLNSGANEIRFNAELAGQFTIELHPANAPEKDIPLGLLQVLPR